MKKPPYKVIKALAARLSELGINAKNLNDSQIPDSALGMVAHGEARLLVIRGPHKCPCCGKPQIRALLTKTSTKPLEEIFK